jgi:hypothetical protein
MPRRNKALSREQRSKRAAKKAARQAAAEERLSRRDARRIAAGKILSDPLAMGEAAYRFAVLQAREEPGELVVCERCGLLQLNDRSRSYTEDNGVVRITSCQGFEGIGCGSTYAITVEGAGGLVTARL